MTHLSPSARSHTAASSRSSRDVDLFRSLFLSGFSPHNCPCLCLGPDKCLAHVLSFYHDLRSLSQRGFALGRLLQERIAAELEAFRRRTVKRLQVSRLEASWNQKDRRNDRKFTRAEATWKQIERHREREQQRGRKCIPREREIQGNITNRDRASR